MSNIIDSIQLSGSSYDVRDKSATTVVEITQSDYDNLPSSAKTSNILYIITDGSVDYITSAQCQTQINNSISGKQDTLVSGTNIKTINNESLLGSGNIDIQGGGGKAVTGGTNISVVSGETADTINCTLPIYINPYAGRGDINIGTENNANYDYYRIAIGRRIEMSSTQGGGSIAIGVADSNSVNKNKCYGGSNVAIGRIFQIGESDSYSGARHGCVVIGNNAKSLINSGVAIGSQTTVSGTTKTNINNQLTIDTSNQVYISNSANTSTYCLQEKIENTETALGGLKLVKLSQSEYDSLATKDNSTLYVIVN